MLKIWQNQVIFCGNMSNKSLFWNIFRTFALLKPTTMKAKKILFINQEMTPYVPESEMADMGRNLPEAIQEKGREIRTFMPKWGVINERRNQLHEVIRLSGMNIIIDDTDHPLIIKVASIQAARMQVYFIDNDDYFMKREMASDNNGENIADNGERAIFFARGVLETVKKLRWVPDIIHCQGWISGVVPLYVKTAYHDEPSFRDAKVVTSLFGKELKTNFGDNFKQSVVFRDATKELIDGYDDKFGYNELGKLAIDYSDGVVEAEKGANEELLNYAKNKKIPFLKYPGALGYADAYNDLYDQVTEDVED